ncbi:DUF2892 domain-containing protein [Candidatus Nanohaloarchaea archaeon]|nr:DUF2892 domain-containing protein [Candidatus Nanohaloarchaea archaeon]
MEKNVGDTDRKIRMALGTILVALGAAGYAGVIPIANVAPQALTSVALTVVGIVLLVTGYTSKCALYSALRIDTSE